MSQPALKPRPPLRLALITPDGIAVYEGRKPVAALHTDYAWSPAEVEEVRVDNYPVEGTA